MVSVDMNVGHLAIAVLDCYGNPVCAPITIPLVLAGLPSSTRDGRIRAAISQILDIAEVYWAGAVVIENLGFDAARTLGRGHTGNRPSRGKRGKVFRRHISGLPTAKLADRLSQIAYNCGVAVIAVDPASTSKWGARHWPDPLRGQYPRQGLTGHHAASVAIGRSGLGQRLRRRDASARTPPVDGERATGSVPAGAHTGLGCWSVRQREQQGTGNKNRHEATIEGSHTADPERWQSDHSAYRKRRGPGGSRPFGAAHWAKFTIARCLGAVHSGGEPDDRTTGGDPPSPQAHTGGRPPPQRARCGPPVGTIAGVPRSVRG
ncbi:MAG: hypothetical protein ACYCV7_14280 [Acidimicrobiales bacterium]